MGDVELATAAMIKRQLGTPKLNYNKYGLRFDIKALNNVGLLVIYLPLEDMRHLVDQVAATLIRNNNERYLQEVLKVSPRDPNINATTIGNLAYVATSLPAENVYTKAAFQLLNQIYERVEKETGGV